MFNHLLYTNIKTSHKWSWLLTVLRFTISSSCPSYTSICTTNTHPYVNYANIYRVACCESYIHHGAIGYLSVAPSSLTSTPACCPWRMLCPCKLDDTSAGDVLALSKEHALGNWSFSSVSTLILTLFQISFGSVRWWSGTYWEIDGHISINCLHDCRGGGELRNIKQGE